VECGQGAIEIKLVTATDALIQQGAHQGCSELFETSLSHAAHHKNLVQHENQGSWHPTDNENRLQKLFAFKTSFLACIPSRCTFAKIVSCIGGRDVGHYSTYVLKNTQTASLYNYKIKGCAGLFSTRPHALR
jgi:hypothetical protein